MSAIVKTPKCVWWRVYGCGWSKNHYLAGMIWWTRYASACWRWSCLTASRKPTASTPDQPELWLSKLVRNNIHLHFVPRPSPISLSLSPFLSLSLPLPSYLSLSPSPFLSLPLPSYLSLSLPLPISLSPSPFLSLSLPLPSYLSLSLSISPSPSPFLSVSLPLPSYLSLSPSLSLSLPISLSLPLSPSPFLSLSLPLPSYQGRSKHILGGPACGCNQGAWPINRCGLGVSTV